MKVLSILLLILTSTAQGKNLHEIMHHNLCHASEQLSKKSELLSVIIEQGQLPGDYDAMNARLDCNLELVIFLQRAASLMIQETDSQVLEWIYEFSKSWVDLKQLTNTNGKRVEILTEDELKKGFNFQSIDLVSEKMMVSKWEQLKDLYECIEDSDAGVETKGMIAEYYLGLY